ncbi:hypothetical protein PR202_ga31093 [Eleusine coracana subsp. coracana]|uniref:Terpene synthase N-terminal domain-containing protein n=1 Tax=Eleusine coracana subsp. coracana TaxID=191504 RepID=A0AAV5DQJ5_ELECO|nr:hypothetical protein PR202_ga31093 [Eleusine coracana subsp. coracana]
MPLAKSRMLAMLRKWKRRATVSREGEGEERVVWRGEGEEGARKEEKERMEAAWREWKSRERGGKYIFTDHQNGHIIYMNRHWTPDGLAHTKNCPVKDIDDTAMGFRLLRLHGYHVDPCVLKHFEKDGKFFCLHGESNPSSVTPMYNTYRAAQLMFPGDDNVLRRAEVFCRDFLLQRRASNRMKDKWAIAKDILGEVDYAIDFPWKASLPRIETRMYLQQYGGSSDVWIGKVLHRLRLRHIQQNSGGRQIHGARKPFPPPERARERSKEKEAPVEAEGEEEVLAPAKAEEQEEHGGLGLARFCVGAAGRRRGGGAEAQRVGRARGGEREECAGGGGLRRRERAGEAGPMARGGDGPGGGTEGGGAPMAGLDGGGGGVVTTGLDGGGGGVRRRTPRSPAPKGRRRAEEDASIADARAGAGGRARAGGGPGAGAPPHARPVEWMRKDRGIGEEERERERERERDFVGNSEVKNAG